MKRDISHYMLAVLFYCLPFMLADNYYIDDNGRATEGYAGWGKDGRPLADMLMRLLNFSHRLVDLHPLNLFICALLLAVAFAFLNKDLSRKESDKNTAFFIPLLLIGNLFYLEALAYRFDSITITFSVCCAVFAARFYPGSKQNFFFTLILAVAVLCLYQSVFNVFIILCLLNFIIFANSEVRARKIIISCGIKLLAAVVAVALYYKIILPLTFSGEYRPDHPGLATTLTMDKLAHNFLMMVQIVAAQLSERYGRTLLVMLFVIALLSCLSIARRNFCKGKIVTFTVAVSPVLAFTAIFGVLLPLETVLHSPRLYLAVGAFICFAFAVLYIALPPSLKRANWLCLILIMHAVILDYAYGNVVKSQNKMNELLVAKLAMNFPDAGEKTKLFFTGDYPKSPVADNTLNVFPELTALMPNYFTNWWWPVKYFSRLGFTIAYPGAITVSDFMHQTQLCKKGQLLRQRDYDIYKLKDYALIDFTKKACQ